MTGTPVEKLGWPTYSFGNLLREVFKLFVEGLATLQLGLLQLNFILIAVSVFALPITRFVKLDVGGFTVNLNIL